MPWCDEAGGGGAPGGGAAASATPGADKVNSFAPAAPAAKESAAPPAKQAKGKPKTDDPDAGGQ